MRKCTICRKHDVEQKDYRFIDSCGLQGKILVCSWCKGLNDVTVCEIIRDGIDPLDFYDQDIIKTMKQILPEIVE